MRRTTDDGFEVRLTQLPPGRCQIDLYHDDQYLGEYERSSQGEVERKVAEVIAARHFLFDVFRNHGPWVVRWATSVRTGKRTKCVRVRDVEVTEIPRQHWGDPSWVR